MEYIPYDDFPEIQQKIIKIKIDKPDITYEQWISEIKNNYHYEFTDTTLVHFILKTALGYYWEEFSKGGRNPYLCPFDFEEFHELLLEEIDDQNNYIEPEKFIELAVEIKTSRLISAFRFLKYIHCPKLASKLTEIVDNEPSHQWIYDVVEKLGLQIESAIDIEEKRFESSSYNLLHEFYCKHERLIRSCPRPLIFGADETMLESILNKKVITTLEKHSILRKNVKIPHITSMCCHSITGVSIPLFIILLNSIENLPDELTDFSDYNISWFASSKSGWMTRDLFLIWAIHFISWFSIYKRNLPQYIRNKRALLILD